MFGRGFCSRGVTDIIAVKKGCTVNAKYYREKIIPIYLNAMEDPALFPSKIKITFMHDGATAHNTKVNMQVLEEKVPTIRGKGIWPGNSPDLNPIDNLRSELKDKINSKPVPTTRDQLITRVQKVWKRIDVTSLQKFSRSFPNRIREMREAGVGHTKY